jgi:hypothetical protein
VALLDQPLAKVRTKKPRAASDKNAFEHG